jgi:hypothetical protein
LKREEVGFLKKKVNKKWIEWDLEAGRRFFKCKQKFGFERM